MTARTEPLVTVADLDLMPDDGNRYEIIDGEMLVSRTPGLTHQTISANLLVSLKNYLVQNPVGDVWATPGVVFDDLNAVIPDLVFVSKGRRAEVAPGERIVGAPDILIEILSPGSENERRDRVIKRQLYARFGVKEYWIIDPINQAVEIFALNDNVLTAVSNLGGTDEITSPLLPGYVCSLATIFHA